MAEHFHALRVAEVVPETSEANSIRFEIPAELRERFAFKPGQHLTLRTTLGGEEVRRNYSLCTAPDEQDWMVTVKRIGGGLFSNWVGDELKAGDVIDVMPPHGSFTTEFDAAKSRHLVGIAGGSGITPVMSLLRSTLRYEPASRFTLLYGNRDSSSVIFLEALAALKDKYLDRLDIYHFLDQEEQDIELFNGMLDRVEAAAHPLRIDAAADLLHDLAHRPAQRLDQVRFAAAVRSDHAGEAGFDHEISGFNERLETVEAEAREFHRHKSLLAGRESPSRDNTIEGNVEVRLSRVMRLSWAATMAAPWRKGNRGN